MGKIYFGLDMLAAWTKYIWNYIGSSMERTCVELDMEALWTD
jgi:hypothetical protein